jgi:hypothetical protein
MADAEPIGEAVTRLTMRFVPIKDLTQQNIQTLHRIRKGLRSGLPWSDASHIMTSSRKPSARPIRPANAYWRFRGVTH